MTNIYAMRRANGDWFALEDQGRLRVPLFRSSHDAMMARLRNFQMLLFKPVVMDALVRKEIKPAGGGSKVDFFIVRDPFSSLTGGRPAQLASLMSNHDEGPTILPTMETALFFRLSGGTKNTASQPPTGLRKY